MSNRFNKVLDNVSTRVINLKTRKDKRKHVCTHLRRKELKFKIYKALLHENPKRGCLESHLNIIKDAIDRDVKYLLIMEDDVKFIRRPTRIPEPPENWCMLYFGGTVSRVMDDDGNLKVVTPHNNPKKIPIPQWHRAQCWTTHAYIVNLTNEDFVKELLKVEEYDQEIDRYYIEKLQPNFPSYIIDPMIAIQNSGYSDIEGCEVDYGFMEMTLYGLKQPEHEITDEGEYILKLPDFPDTELPRVSIITPTYKRRNLFNIALRNFMQFEYPPEKLEWIIVDDTPDSARTIEDMLPEDDRIVYLKLEGNEQPLTIAQKRNIGAQRATAEYIVHMDDDDIYPQHSILARVKLLMKYEKEGIRCVGCTKIAVYDIIQNISTITSDSPISFSEATMAYMKKFWEEQQFKDGTIRGEHKDLMENRLNQCMDMPYEHIICAINHKGNFTNTIREVKGEHLKNARTGEKMNFFDTWDESTQFFITMMRNKLKSEREMNDIFDKNNITGVLPDQEEKKEEKEETLDNKLGSIIGNLQLDL